MHIENRYDSLIEKHRTSPGGRPEISCSKQIVKMAWRFKWHVK